MDPICLIDFVIFSVFLMLTTVKLHLILLLTPSTCMELNLTDVFHIMFFIIKLSVSSFFVVCSSVNSTTVPSDQPLNFIFLFNKLIIFCYSPSFCVMPLSNKIYNININKFYFTYLINDLFSIVTTLSV